MTDCEEPTTESVLFEDLARLRGLVDAARRAPLVKKADAIFDALSAADDLFAGIIQAIGTLETSLEAMEREPEYDDGL